MKTVYIMPIIVEVRKTFDNQHYVIRRNGKIAFLHGRKKAVRKQRHYFFRLRLFIFGTDPKSGISAVGFLRHHKTKLRFGRGEGICNAKNITATNRKANHCNKNTNSFKASISSAFKRAVGALQ